MDLTQIIGVLSTIFIVGFLVFGLRRGLRQKRENRRD